jgi:hypothetical protein
MDTLETYHIPRLMIVTIKAIMNILNKIKNNRDKRHINLKANHIMVPHLWWIKIGTKQTKIKMENLKTLGSKSSTHNAPPWTKSSPLG